MEKCAWLVVRKPDIDAESFRTLLLSEVGPAATMLVPSTTEVVVTPRELDQFTNAFVDLATGEESFDGFIEVTTAESYVPLDDFTAFLQERSRYLAGWRVHPTLIFDARRSVALGEPSHDPLVMVFLERIDGTTPAFFTRNWYMHAGHPDGEEAENDAAGEKRAATEASVREAPDQALITHYTQNRVIESVAPTPWVTHGYTQLSTTTFVPPEGADGDGHVRAPGEEVFDRWPPRFFQGYAHRVA